MKKKGQAVSLNLHVVNAMVSFMADEECLKKLADLQKKLKMSRSEVIRVAIDDAVDKYVAPADREFYVVDKDWMSMIQKIEHLSATCEAYMKERYREQLNIEEIKRSPIFRDSLSEKDVFGKLVEALQTPDWKISLRDLANCLRFPADLDKTRESEVTDK